VECPDVYDCVQEGDEMQIDLAAGRIRHGGTEHAFPQMPESVRQILEFGGLAAYLKTQLNNPGRR
jgi:hypothetical protein